MEEDDESIFATQPTNSMGKGNRLGYEQAEKKETYNLLLASCDGGVWGYGIPYLDSKKQNFPWHTIQVFRNIVQYVCQMGD